MRKLCVVVHTLLLMILCARLCVSQDVPGLNFVNTTCIPLAILSPSFPPACVTTELIPCEETIIANISMGDFINEGARVDGDTHQCAPIPIFPGCQVCLEFEHFDVTPSGANLRPYITIEDSDSSIPCTLVNTGNFGFGDVVLGTDCSAANCATCLDLLNCGWCGDTNSCAVGDILGDDGPYCGDCGDDSSWIPAESLQSRCFPADVTNLAQLTLAPCDINFDPEVTIFYCDLPHNVDDLNIDYGLVGRGSVQIYVNDVFIDDSQLSQIPISHEFGSKVKVIVLDEFDNPIPPEYHVTVLRVSAVPSEPPGDMTAAPTSSSTAFPVPTEEIEISDINIDECAWEFDVSRHVYDCSVDVDQVFLHVITNPSIFPHEKGAISIEVDKVLLEDWTLQTPIDVKMNATTIIDVFLIVEGEGIKTSYSVEITRGVIPADDVTTVPGNSVPSTAVIIGMTIGSIGLVALFAAFLLCNRTSKIYEQVRNASINLPDGAAINRRRISAGGGASGLALAKTKKSFPTPTTSAGPRRYARLDYDDTDPRETTKPSEATAGTGGQILIGSGQRPPPPPLTRVAVNTDHHKKYTSSPSSARTALLSSSAHPQPSEVGVAGLGVVNVKRHHRLEIDDDEDEDGGGRGAQQHFEPVPVPSEADTVSLPNEVIRPAAAVSDKVGGGDGNDQPLLRKD